MSPSRVEEGRRRGSIVAIGGAEDHLRDPEILRRFVDLCGGRRAKIAVVPTASEREDTGRRYEEVFKGLGARGVRIFYFETRADGERESWIEAIGEAQGIFFTGGNQLRLSTVLGGTPAAKAFRRLNAAGVHIAGTSAGAAFISEHMIAFGDEGSTPRAGMVTLVPGLGLTNRIIVDQHFRQRDRLGRLLTALAYNPFAVGIGLDEDTAAFLDGDNVIEVAGSGAVTIVDPGAIQHTSIDAIKKGEAVSILGVQLHVLAAGGQFDLDNRRARAASSVRSE
ncbi:MAG TPA: cyanophycinase [Candidatus Polarisedimenticolaceae bacterium]|nr:cyanophycinase [Candidatus Polarisedimenticolaceae bacterium]